MLRVTLVVPVPGNAARPGVSTWARRCCSCGLGAAAGAARSGAQGAACGGLGQRKPELAPKAGH